MQTSNKLYKFKEELPLTSGQTLDGFELMVECYGNLNQEKNNIAYTYIRVYMCLNMY